MIRAILDKRIAAFLDLIAWSEGTTESTVTKDDGYDVIVSGVDGAHVMSNYQEHPFATGTPPVVVRRGPPELLSTASGRYQITLETWKEFQKSSRANGFAPATQDLAAYFLLQRRRAIADILAGDIATAIAMCSLEWASFPGSLYGQPMQHMATLTGNYARLLATYK